MTNPNEISERARRLRAAWPAWRASSISERARILRAWREALCARREAIVSALIADTGRTRISTSEFDGTLRRLDYWLERAPKLLEAHSVGQSDTAPSVRYQHRLHPLGVVGIISPWNVPLLLSIIDAIPALLAGCAVMLKPSEVTPRFAEPLRASVQATDTLAGVFDIVSGDGEVGEAMIDVSDAVCFTGSTGTGRKVALRAAARLIPAFLELGGKDPLIVLDDADLARAVAAALRGSVLNTGQACQSIERVYVHESLFEAFVEALVADAKRVKSSVGGEPGAHLGPFIDSRQADTLRAHIEDARLAGAVQHCGEVIETDKGIWCSPIVLTQVDQQMRIMREETFAPVIPVMAYGKDEEAVRLANDSNYGLSAAVIGEEAHALEVARQIHAGAVSINDCGLTTMVSDVEKDSFNESGLGASRMGDRGLLRFVRQQALLVQQGEALPIDAFRE